MAYDSVFGQHGAAQMPRSKRSWSPVVEFMRTPLQAPSEAAPNTPPPG